MSVILLVISKQTRDARTFLLSERRGSSASEVLGTKVVVTFTKLDKLGIVCQYQAH